MVLWEIIPHIAPIWSLVLPLDLSGFMGFIVPYLFGTVSWHGVHGYWVLQVPVAFRDDYDESLMACRPG